MQDFLNEPNNRALRALFNFTLNTCSEDRFDEKPDEFNEKLNVLVKYLISLGVKNDEFKKKLEEDYGTKTDLFSRLIVMFYQTDIENYKNGKIKEVHDEILTLCKKYTSITNSIDEKNKEVDEKNKYIEDIERDIDESIKTDNELMKRISENERDIDESIKTDNEQNGQMEMLYFRENLLNLFTSYERNVKNQLEKLKANRNSLKTEIADLRNQLNNVNMEILKLMISNLRDIRNLKNYDKLYEFSPEYIQDKEKIWLKLKSQIENLEKKEDIEKVVLYTCFPLDIEMLPFLSIVKYAHELYKENNSFTLSTDPTANISDAILYESRPIEQKNNSQSGTTANIYAASVLSANQVPESKAASTAVSTTPASQESKGKIERNTEDIAQVEDLLNGVQESQQSAFMANISAFFSSQGSQSEDKILQVENQNTLVLESQPKVRTQSSTPIDSRAEKVSQDGANISVEQVPESKAASTAESAIPASQESGVKFTTMPKMDQLQLGFLLTPASADQAPESNPDSLAESAITASQESKVENESLALISQNNLETKVEPQVKKEANTFFTEIRIFISDFLSLMGLSKLASWIRNETNSVEDAQDIQKPSQYHEFSKKVLEKVEIDNASNANLLKFKDEISSHIGNREYFQPSSRHPRIIRNYEKREGKYEK